MSGYLIVERLDQPVTIPQVPDLIPLSDDDLALTEDEIVRKHREKIVVGTMVYIVDLSKLPKYRIDVATTKVN